MKRNLILVLLILSSVTSGFADRVALIGGSIGYVSQETTAGQAWDAVSASVLWSGYISVADPIGIYEAVTVGTVLSTTLNGVAINQSLYEMPISINVLAGLGYSIPIGQMFSALVGAGLYYGATSLTPVNYSTSIYRFPGGVGIGAGGSFMYLFAPQIGIGADLNVAYSFLANPFDYNNTMSPGGLSVFGGVGIVFWY
jgi:hypothetical protein